jgi:MFS family permease
MELPVQKSLWQKLRHSQFARFSLFFALIQLSVAVGSPFFAIYLLRDLQFTYVEFMICTAASVALQFLTLTRWGNISDVFGNRVILRFCGMLIPLIPLLWLFSPNFYYLLLVQAFGGIIWAGFTLSASNFLYELIPVGKRATYMAMHNVLASIGIFIGAMLGGYLGTVLPQSFSLLGMDVHWLSALYNVFLLSFVLRLLTAWLFLPRIREARRVRPLRLRRLVFRIGRFNPLSGLFFDVVGSRRKGAEGSENGRESMER